MWTKLFQDSSRSAQPASIAELECYFFAPWLQSDAQGGSSSHLAQKTLFWGGLKPLWEDFCLGPWFESCFGVSHPGSFASWHNPFAGSCSSSVGSGGFRVVASSLSQRPHAGPERLQALRQSISKKQTTQEGKPSRSLHPEC